MKALSLKQPYAELVVSGKKTIELRKWKTNFRGEFLIHASKSVGEFLIHASKSVNTNAMERFGFSDLPLGCIVGKARLLEVKEYKTDEEHIADKDKHLASSVWGKYGFVLCDVVRVEPTPAKGKLNFWEH